MTNQAIISQFNRLIASLQILDPKKYFFQIRSYQRVTEVIQNLPQEIEGIYHDEKNLEQLEGIGPAIESKIIELIETGTCSEIEKYASQMPEAMFELIDIPGIGAKRAYRLTTEFELKPGKAVEQLKAVAQAGKIRQLDGFGEKSEQDILQNISILANSQASYSRDEARKFAEPLLQSIRTQTETVAVELMGSSRRGKAHVRDIDIGIATNDFAPIKNELKKLKIIQIVLADGPQLLRVILKNGIQVDIKTSPPKQWGAFLQHFTGSKDHNIKLRELALKQGKSLSEHGIKILSTGELKEFNNEPDFYGFLGLNFIPPAERLGNDEIMRAKK